MKTFNLKKILRLYLPSVIFFGFLATHALASNMLLINIIAGIFALLIVVNLFLQNMLLSRILGTFFLLGSLYMVLAFFDDVFDGEATIEYLFGFFMILFSIAMSILLIIGYNKHHQEEINGHTEA